MIFALAATVAVTVVGLAGLRTDTGPESFLPADDEHLEALHDAASSFGGDPVIVLAESPGPGQLLDREQLPRLLGLEGRLAQLPDVAVVYGPGTVLNQIAVASQQLLAELSGRRDAIHATAVQRARSQGAPPEQARAAADASVAAFDERYGSLLVSALPAGLPTLRNPGFVDAVVFDGSGNPRPQWRFVVPAPDAIAISIRPRQDVDQATTERLVDAVRLAVEQSGLRTERVTITGTPAVVAALGQQVRQEILLLGALALGLIATCYLAVGWLGRKRYRLLPLAAALSATALTLAAFGWLGRPLSLGVIALLPILVGIGSDFAAYLVGAAQRRRVLVVALASATAFASLAVSPMPFVRDLGLALGAGVLLAVGVALLFRRYLVRHDLSEPAPATPSVALSAHKRVGALVFVGAVAVSGWAGLPHLDVEARPDQLASGLPAMTDVRHAERVLGSSGEIGIVLRGTDVLTPAALGWMRRAQDAMIVEYGGQLRPIVSLPDLLNFLGPSPTQEQIKSGMQLMPSYLTGAVVRSDARRALLSFGVELQDLEDQQHLLDGIRTTLPSPPPGMAADVVGLPVAAAHGYDLVSDHRYLANLVGIFAAGFVLAVGLRRRFDAFRAVLAAALATGWGLAGVFIFGVSLSPLTVALGSLATATACEFTVLLADSYRRGSAQLRRTVAAAALAAAAGYAALAASGLSMIREFGLLLATTVVLSFIAAHLVVRLFPTSQPRHSQ